MPAATTMGATEKDIFHRSRLVLGKEGLERLHFSKIIIFGLGGVGSWCAESLARTGACRITIVDPDSVCPTNINRQVQATSLNTGKKKVFELEKRLLEINPAGKFIPLDVFYDGDKSDSFNLSKYDYVIDAIDSLDSKKHLIQEAWQCRTTLFSSMGAARKKDPSRIRVDSIWKTYSCPIARILRKHFKIHLPEIDFSCVYSDEPPVGERETFTEDSRKGVNGSIVHITAIFGMNLASMVINDILDTVNKNR